MVLARTPLIHGLRWISRKISSRAGGAGAAAEHLVGARDLDAQSAAHLEAPVQRRGAHFAIGMQDCVLEQSEQHLVEPPEPHRAVEAAHELLHRAVVRLVDEAEHLGHATLVIEQQAIFATAGEVVQGAADAPQVIAAADERVVLLRGQEPVRSVPAGPRRGNGGSRPRR